MKSRTTKEAACFRIRLADRDPPTPPRQFVSDGQASDPSTKDCRGFDQAFPLAHKYLGFRDFFGRSNINTPNVLLTMKPSPKCQVLVWYYYIFLDNLKGTPYSVIMTPIHPTFTPQSRDLGHEIDIALTYNLSDRDEILLGYSHFFSGRY